ncbi:MAG TPA: DNA repair protein RecO [Pyrinomonadaceae bacterium]|nr:DNA repair protein RecO [Pyrinomonadaceae bacterium]
MGLVETQAIVLQTFKLADADKIAVCMTEKAGLVRGVARGARRLKSRFGAGLEPFTVIRLIYFEKESRELVTIKEAEIVKSYFGAARDAEVVQALGYLAELVKEFAPPQQPDEKLYRMLRASIDAAARNAEMLHPVTVYTELWALKLTGLLADLRRCAGCGRHPSEVGGEVYISSEGVVRCRECRRSDWQAIGADVHELLGSMRSFGPETWARAYLEASKESRLTLSSLAGRLVSRALEREPRANRVAEKVSPAASAGSVE